MCHDHARCYGGISSELKLMLKDDIRWLAISIPYLYTALALEIAKLAYGGYISQVFSYEIGPLDLHFWKLKLKGRPDLCVCVYVCVCVCVCVRVWGKGTIQFQSILFLLQLGKHFDSWGWVPTISISELIPAQNTRQAFAYRWKDSRAHSFC